jgi:iron complex transport system substrate-binding protein
MNIGKRHKALTLAFAAILAATIAIPAATQQKQGATRTIVDQTGAKVTIPAKIERVVITSIWPLPSVFCLVDGSGKKIVGMHPASISAAKTSMLAKTAPDALKASTSFIQGTTINIEELIKLKPDVVLYSATNTGERDLLEKAGLKAIGFSTTIADYNTIDTVVSWMDLLGEILDKKTRAEEIKKYGYETLGMIYSRTWNLSDDKKPKALILFRHSESDITATGKNFFGDFWLRSTGAVNVAAELNGSQKVNMEQIYKWNPEIIYITNFSASLPEDFYNNAITGQDWSKVSAVKNRKVYKVPLGHYRWFPPSSDSPLMLLWLAKKNQAELFADVDFDAALKDYFLRFHNYKLTDADIKSILNPPREAANGV